jgi:FkbM family methyltransferase
MRSILEIFKKQYLKLNRNRWDRFQNSGRQFITHHYRNLFKIRLYKDSYLSEEIYRNKFEPDEGQFINDFLMEGDIFVDIGANIGLYTLMAARKIGSAGKVYSFEPTQTTFKRLLDNIAINGFKNIIPVNKALSDKNGSFEMNVSCDGFDGWNSFVKITRGSKARTETVETIKVDSFFHDNKIWGNISLIKIDVEGWEKFVILGGEEHFKRPESPVLIIEFVDQNTINAGYTCKELFQLLVSFGYTLYSIKDRILEKEHVKENYIYSNLVAAKELKEIKKRLRTWQIKE